VAHPHQSGDVCAEQHHQDHLAQRGAVQGDVAAGQHSPPRTPIVIKVTQRAVARGFARSASICPAGPHVRSNRLGQTLQHAGHAGAAAAGTQNQIRRKNRSSWSANRTWGPPCPAECPAARQLRCSHPACHCHEQTIDHLSVRVISSRLPELVMLEKVKLTPQRAPARRA
jgi:hypothetical protein